MKLKTLSFTTITYPLTNVIQNETENAFIHDLNYPLTNAMQNETENAFIHGYRLCINECNIE